jgi:hypothetical protein
MIKRRNKMLDEEDFVDSILDDCDESIDDYDDFIDEENENRYDNELNNLCNNWEDA